MKTFLLVTALLFSKLLLAANKTWTGSTSTAWSTASNWSGGTVPGSGDDVIIPTSPSGGRMPTISSNISVKSITIQTGATLTHTSGTLSVIGGDLDITGTYDISGGTLLTDKDVLIKSGGLITQSGGTVHLASSTGNDPTDDLSISANGNYNFSSGILKTKDLVTTSGSPNGTFTQSGGTLYVYHDFKGSGTFTASAGTIEFADDAGGGSFPTSITSSNTQFYHVVIDSGVDPAFDNNTSSFNVAGDWTNNSSSTSLTGSTTTVIFNGTGTQTITGSQTTTFRNLTVDKPSGTLTLSRNSAVNGGNLTVSSGTLDIGTYTLNRTASGGTFSVANGAKVILAANTGGQTGSNFPSNFSTVSLGSTSTIEYDGLNSVTQTIYAGATYGHLTLTNGSGSGTATKSTSSNLTVNGNLTVNSNTLLNPGAANTIGGTGTITGTGTMRVTRTTSTADLNNQYTISNKTFTNITVDYNATGSQTVNAHNYYNLTISGSRGTNTVTLASSGTIGISGTFSPSASFSSGGYTLTGSTVNFNGSSPQNIPAFTFNNLSISNSAKTATGVIDVDGTFTLSSCVLTTTSTNLLVIENNATATGAGLTAYVNGPVKKVGNDAFTFPVGKSGTGYMPISISAPSWWTDEFTAEYMRSSGTSLGGITASGLYRVSNCDYWNLNRNAGSSSVNVTLSWNGYSNCNAAAFVSDLASLTVAHFNGTNWDTHGKNSTTGNASSGTVTRNSVSTFSPFAIGSTSDLMNPLLVSFSSIKANRSGNQVLVDWVNLTEDQINHYEIERSVNGTDFIMAGTKTAAVNNGNRAAYTWPDPAAGNQAVYYRIKAVARSGQFNYSTVVKVGPVLATNLSIYPNPVSGNRINVTGIGLPAGAYTAQVFDISGNQIQHTQINYPGNNEQINVPLPEKRQPGIYSLRITGNGYNLVKSFICQ